MGTEPQSPHTTAGERITRETLPAVGSSAGFQEAAWEIVERAEKVLHPSAGWWEPGRMGWDRDRDGDRDGDRDRIGKEWE